MLSNASTPWIPGSSSDLSIQANAMLGLEDDASWKSSAGCQSPISLDPMAKENAVSCAFDSEWFIAPAPTTFHRTDGIKELSYGSSIAHHQQLEQTAAAPATPPSSALAGALNLEAFQLQSFLSRSMIASSSSQQQQQQQQPIGLGSLVEGASIGLENGAGSIALDSDGSILLDDNGHIIASSRGSFNSTAGSFVQSSTGAFSSSKNGPGSSLGICCSPLGMARSNTTISDHHAKVVLSPRSSPSKAFEGFNIFNGLKSPSGSGVFNNCGSTSPSPRKTGNRGDCPSNSTTPRKLGSTSVLPPPLRTATTLPKPLEPLSATPPCSGARPTLFQKRALSRNASAVSPSKLLVKQPMLAVPSSCSPAMNTMITPDEESPNIIRGTNLQKRHLLLASPSKGYSQLLLGKSGSPLKKRTWDEEWEDDEQLGEGNEMEDDESGDGSGVVHELGSNLANGVAGDGKKSLKKGMPAKNLLAERRRRKKLNDRLYMLRSVVPKITKMDRASILGDAIEYLKELLQRINDMHNELEAQAEKTTAAPLVPPAPALTTTPTSSSLAGSCGRPLVKEECSTSLSSPESQQPARIEVKMRDGKDFNIHMFCTMRPGLLLSMMKALDGLGLDVQQAVISCFNGFVFDIFRAETMKEGDVGPEEIKTVLLHTAGCQSVI